MRPLFFVLGGLLVVVGAVWTFQGLGILEGSPMTGVDTWAMIGPVVAGLGVALIVVAARRRPRRPSRVPATA